MALAQISRSRNKNLSLSLSLFLLLLLLCSVPVFEAEAMNSSSTRTGNSTEIEILLQIKSTLTDYSSTSNSSSSSSSAALQTWTPKSISPPCWWQGISCDASGSVTGLDLQRQSLAGNLSAAAAAMAKLSNLRMLNLNDNPFMAGPIPAPIFSMTRLAQLLLSNCTLTGSIPAELGRLTQLQVLELSWNFLSGFIPAEIGHLSQLRQLQLYKNSLSGPLPQTFERLKSLQSLDASTNHLNGNLTVLAGLDALNLLQLYQNNFSGPVPSQIAGFRHLKELSLYRNRLDGPLPESLGRFSELQAVDVSENAFSGNLPPGICTNGKLRFLLLVQNQFSGTIPGSYQLCYALTRFRVSKNRLRGTVPPGIWGLPHAAIIDLSFNEFEGEIGGSIAQAKNLSFLSIQNNRFSGALPPEIGQAGLLSRFHARYNRIGGELPEEIGFLSSLSSLLLQGNRLSGSLPEKLGSCKALSELNLAGNSLGGPIPESLGYLPNLDVLNLSNNKITGSIPASFAGLQLSSFDLSNNLLTGEVPAQLLGQQANNQTFAGNKGLCVRHVHSVFLKSCPSISDRARSRLAALVTVIVFLLALLIICARYYLLHKRSNESNPADGNDDEALLPWDLTSYYKVDFSAETVLKFVKQENQIGNGGSGIVYRGDLGNGETIAIKQLRRTDGGSNNHKRDHGCREFITEVQTLSLIRHKNIVKLYCSISNGRSHFLVYEYLQNGSLWNKLHGLKHPVMDWATRYKIALGTARGLSYLHHDCVPAIVHRDVNSSNILLNADYEPSLSDFGIAKLLRWCGNAESTAVIAGTHGYMPPEVAHTYKVSEKSDVYSFGIVLLELVTGKKPTGCSEFAEHENILQWVSRKISWGGNIMNILDDRIVSEYSSGQSMMKVLKIGLVCSSNVPAMRPAMRQVCHMLREVEPNLASKCLSACHVGGEN